MGISKLVGAALAAAPALGQSTFTIDADTCFAGGAKSCRALDGIGGLSGGGATSVFLPYYPEPQRSEVLVCFGCVFCDKHEAEVELKISWLNL